MVMKRKNMMGRNLWQTIRKSMGRYIAIMAIVALGAGLFCGLRVTKVDMIATVQKYTDQQNMFDLQVMNSYGWTQENVEAMGRIPGIAQAEGSISIDALVRFGNEDDAAYKLISIPSSVNLVDLSEGRMPVSDNECLLDGFFFSKAMIGQEIRISEANEESTLDQFAHDTYTVVGLVNTPLYLNMQRGSTTIGSGSLSSFIYIPRDGFALEYYTEINMTLAGTHAVYSDAYNDAMDDMVEFLDYEAQEEADLRHAQVLEEAEASYAEGLAEYLEGTEEFRDGRNEALRAFREAEWALAAGAEELEENRLVLEEGKKQLEDAQKEIDTNLKAIEEAQSALDDAKADAYSQLEDAKAELDANYFQVAPALNQVNSGIAQIEDGLAQIDDGIAQIDDGLNQINDGIAQLEDAIDQIDSGLTQLRLMMVFLESAAEDAQNTLDFLESMGITDSELVAELIAQLEDLIAQRDSYSQQIAELEATRAECAAQLEALYPQKEELEATRAELVAQREPIEAQYQELLATKATLDDAMAQINDGYAQLSAARAEANAQFAVAQAQIDEGRNQLTEAQTLLDEKSKELRDGEKALREGEQTLTESRRELEMARADAEAEFARAEEELARGKAQLYQARRDIDNLGAPALYVLTRNTNLGYVVFESDSNIVAGVAKIFPLFFLAVAALVCITTMTRMIDEERTQIGILKALGYSSGSIMGKYLAYSGSASLAGCLLGLLLGSTVFPSIIWYAYCIMYDFSDQLTLSYDPFTIAFIFLSYTGLILLVTWNCCRRELKEVPAELIRPKPPVSGKQIFLEKLFFWKNLKFLNKVAIRNIFRYRQRLAMMLLGIGGCTALLVTGYGLNDSVSDIVSYQFETVTLYDIGVTFHEPLDEEGRREFLEANPDQQILFCYQGGIDLEFDNSVKNVYFLAVDGNLEGFIDLHRDDEKIPMPGKNEAVISIGAATAMGIEPGDTVVLRNADLEELTVTVSGVYDNNVNNYAIVSGETLRAQWGRDPEIQTAFVLASEGQDVHDLGEQVAACEGVLTMNINQDLANTVGGMMDALDAVIVVVVVCAGLLAGIVLYNLTNINIQERIREIATIKVLGFKAGETASYVFKENLTLTVVGTLVGLLAGKWLHAMVMSYVRIDMVWFANRINPQSYVISAVLTILSALIVDFVMYFRLEKINMAEALKSVE